MNEENDELVPFSRRPQHDFHEYEETLQDPYETGEEDEEDSVSQHDPRRSWTRPTDPGEIPRLIVVDRYQESRERLDAIEAGFRFLQHRREQRQPIKYNTIERTTRPRTQRSTSRQKTPPSREFSSPEQVKPSMTYQTSRLDSVMEVEATPLSSQVQQRSREPLRSVQEHVVLLEEIDRNELAYEQVEGEEERLHPS